MQLDQWQALERPLALLSRYLPVKDEQEVL